MQKNNVKSRKAWAAPELKKVDIEAITASFSGSTGESAHPTTHHS